jgi:hypothetical protein
MTERIDFPVTCIRYSKKAAPADVYFDYFLVLAARAVQWGASIFLRDIRAMSPPSTAPPRLRQLTLRCCFGSMFLVEGLIDAVIPPELILGRVQRRPILEGFKHCASSQTILKDAQPNLAGRQMGIWSFFPNCKSVDWGKDCEIFAARPHPTEP